MGEEKREKTRVCFSEKRRREDTRVVNVFPGNTGEGENKPVTRSTRTQELFRNNTRENNILRTPTLLQEEENSQNLGVPALGPTLRIRRRKDEVSSPRGSPAPAEA